MCACALAEGILRCSQSHGTGGQLGGVQGRSRRGPESCPSGSRPAPVLPSSLKGDPHPRPSSWGPCCPWLLFLPSLLCNLALASSPAPEYKHPSRCSQLPLWALLPTAVSLGPLLLPPQMPPGVSPAPSRGPVHVAPAAAGGTWPCPSLSCADIPCPVPVPSLGAPWFSERLHSRHSMTGLSSPEGQYVGVCFGFFSSKGGVGSVPLVLGLLGSGGPWLQTQKPGTACLGRRQSCWLTCHPASL